MTLNLLTILIIAVGIFSVASIGGLVFGPAFIFLILIGLFFLYRYGKKIEYDYRLVVNMDFTAEGMIENSIPNFSQYTASTRKTLTSVLNDRLARIHNIKFDVEALGFKYYLTNPSELNKYKNKILIALSDIEKAIYVADETLKKGESA